ncbi:MAG: hypothetical protein NC548_61635 [Lachnospiraceae bacterium]|nr:hypothetical protein [Lachnospiraceae bacterium]
MYQRIKNRLDAGFLLGEMKAEGKNVFVGERIMELTGVLDDSYGADRKAHDMGGYILYFPDAKSYEDAIVDIWEFYHIEPTLYEYAEYIGGSGENGIQWIEKLFLLSSDDSLVLVYPQEAG